MRNASLEELLFLEIEALEEMRVRDEFVADGLIEVQEHESHVLPNVFLNLANPLGMVFAVLDHSVVGLETELNLLKNLFGRVVR